MSHIRDDHGYSFMWFWRMLNGNTDRLPALRETERGRGRTGRGGGELYVNDFATELVIHILARDL